MNLGEILRQDMRLWTEFMWLRVDPVAG